MIIHTVAALQTVWQSNQLVQCDNRTNYCSRTLSSWLWMITQCKYSNSEDRLIKTVWTRYIFIACYRSIHGVAYVLRTVSIQWTNASSLDTSLGLYTHPFICEWTPLRTHPIEKEIVKPEPGQGLWGAGCTRVVVTPPRSRFSLFHKSRMPLGVHPILPR